MLFAKPNLAALLPLMIAMAVFVIARHRQVRQWLRLIKGLIDTALADSNIDHWRDFLVVFA